MTVADILADPGFAWDRRPPAAREVWEAFDGGLPPAAPAAYREFMRLCDGGSGDIPHASGFLWLWPAETAASLHVGYGFPEWLPGFLGFGSDGAGLLFCFDLRGHAEAAVCTVEATGMDAADVRVEAPGFLPLLRETLGWDRRTRR